MKSFRDFMLECEMFPYSQDSYDLDKACTEAALMEKYISTQRFILENGDTMTLTPGYLLESVDASTIQVLEEKLQAKMQLFAESVRSRISSIIKAIKNFFLKLFGRQKKSNEKKKKTKEKMKGASLSSDAAKVIADGLKSASEKTGFVAYKDQPSSSPVNLGDTTANALLAAAFSETSVRADVSKAEDVTVENMTVGPVDILVLAGCIDKLAKGASYSELMSCVTSITKSYTTAKSKGYIEFPVDDAKIEKAMEQLKDYTDTSHQDDDAELMKAMNSLHNVIMAVIPKTMKLYNDYTMFVSSADTIVSKWLAGGSDDKAASTEESK